MEILRFISLLPGKLFGSRLKMNFLSGALATGLVAVLGLVKSPVYLHYMNYDGYGLYALLGIIPSLSALGMLGISNGVMRMVAEKFGEGDFEGLGEFVNTAVSFVFAVSCAVLCAVYILRCNFPHLLGIGAENEDAFLAAFGVACILTFLTLLNAPLLGALSGIGRLDLSNYFSLGISYSGFIFAFMLIGKLGLKGVFIGEILGIFPIMLFEVIALRRNKVPLLSGALFKYSRFKELVGFGLPVASGTMMWTGTLSLLKVIIGRAAGVEAVGCFNLAYALCAPAQSIIASAFGALVPEISILAAQRGKEDMVARINRKAMKISFAMAFALAAGMSVAGPLFIKIWLGSRFNQAVVDVFYAMLPTMFLATLILMPYYNLLAAKRVGAFFCYYLSFSIICLGSACVLAGASMATLVNLGLCLSLGQAGAAVFIFTVSSPWWTKDMPSPAVS